MTWLTWPVVRRVVLVLGLALVGYYVVTVIQVWRAARGDGTRPSQAIVVLGAAQYDGEPSPVYRARLDHAANLYAKGVAPTIVVTGGKLPGDRFTEASAGAAYLHTRGVSDAAIVRETTGTSSFESLAASARILQQRGVTRVLLVSDPFHSLRVRLIAEELGLDAATSPTRTSPIGGVDELLRFLGEAVRVAAGRIFGFARAMRVGKLVPGLAILAGPSGVV